MRKIFGAVRDTQSEANRLLVHSGGEWEAQQSRILFLTYNFPPDNTPAALRPGQLVTYLPQYGYKPVVVASTAMDCRLRLPDIYRTPGEQVSNDVCWKSLAANAFTRYLAPYNDRLSWVPQAIAAATRIQTLHPVEAIYSTSPFVAAHVAAMSLKRRYKLPWIADFQDPIVDNPFRGRKWLFPYDAWLERMIFEHADRVIANTDTVASKWRTRYPKLQHKITVCWNSYDPAENIRVFPPSGRSRRILAHVGALYGGRHPVALLSALKKLVDCGMVDASTIQVKHVGAVDEQVRLKHGLFLSEMQEVGLLDYKDQLVPREEALDATADADLLLLLDINEKGAALQVPSKLLDYIRIGKPILAFTPTDSPVQRILNRSGISYIAVAPNAPPETVQQKVLEFLRFPSEQRQPSAWFERTLSCTALAAQFSGILGDLLQKQNGDAKVGWDRFIGHTEADAEGADLSSLGEARASHLVRR